MSEDLATFVRAYIDEHSFDDAQCAACGTVRWRHVDHFLDALAPLVAARVAAARAERDDLAVRLARVEKVAHDLKSAHIRVAIETNITDDYERGQQHAQDDAYRMLRAALAGEPGE